MLHASATSSTGSGSGSNSIGLQPSSCCCCCCYGRQHCTPIATRKHDAAVNVRCRSSDASTLVICDAMTDACWRQRAQLHRRLSSAPLLDLVRSSNRGQIVVHQPDTLSTSYVPWHMQCYARVSSPYSAQQQVSTDHPRRVVVMPY